MWPNKYWPNSFWTGEFWPKTGGLVSPDCVNDSNIQEVVLVSDPSYITPRMILARSIKMAEGER